MSRDIRITPNLGSTTLNQFPRIDFGGLSSSSISLKVDDDGSVVYTGTYGVLFNVTDNKDGLLHSVNDVSGLPILQVYSWDYVQMGKWNKNTLIVNSDKVGVGLTAPSTKLHVYATQSGAFRLQDTTQQSGYVLTSDTNGVGTWQPSGGGGYVNSVTGSVVTTSNTPATAATFNTVTNSAYMIWGYVIGEHNTGATAAVGGSVEGVFRNASGTITSVGANSNIYEDLAGAPSFSLRNSGTNIILEVTGLTSHTITWIANLYYIKT